jgi:hypothetical protein
LDWRRSYSDNRIAELKEEFQGGANRGAATIVSKASSDERVPIRRIFNPDRDIDKETGQKIYRGTGDQQYKYKGQYVFKDKNGDFYYKDKTTGEKTAVPADKVKASLRSEKSNKMTEAFNNGGDAYDLVFDKNNRIERYYADYANKMKAMANEARKEYISTPNLKVNKSAKQVYAEEIQSLDRKLDKALQNAPRERQAQALAYSQLSKIRKYNPDIANDKDAMKKKRAQVIAEARIRTGALKRSDRNIEITDREWEAIQAHAVSNETLKKILRNTDSQKLKERAIPRNQKSVTAASLSRAKSLMRMGYTQEEAAEAIGVSVSTLNRAM